MQKETGHIGSHWKDTFEETDISHLGNCSRNNPQLLLTSLGVDGAEHLPGSTTDLKGSGPWAAVRSSGFIHYIPYLAWITHMPL